LRYYLFIAHQTGNISQYGIRKWCGRHYMFTTYNKEVAFVNMDSKIKSVVDLLQVPGNDQCADCGFEGTYSPYLQLVDYCP